MQLHKRLRCAASGHPSAREVTGLLPRRNGLEATVTARQPQPPSGTVRACENSLFARPPSSDMDTEQINAIGTLLADLSDRTEQLRGYL